MLQRVRKYKHTMRLIHQFVYEESEVGLLLLRVGQELCKICVTASLKVVDSARIWLNGRQVGRSKHLGCRTV